MSSSDAKFEIASAFLSESFSVETEVSSELGTEEAIEKVRSDSRACSPSPKLFEEVGEV